MGFSFNKCKRLKGLDSYVGNIIFCIWTRLYVFRVRFFFCSLIFFFACKCDVSLLPLHAFESHPFIVEAGVSVGGKDVKQVH